jgi:glycosyltransferase involved in cell wall biosynthesis
MWFSPLKLYEYMAAGKAVVASAEGQIVDAIADGESGVLVPPGDSTALAEAIVSLLQDPGRRHCLGRKARQQAVAQHSWDHYIRRLEVVYESVMV